VKILFDNLMTKIQVALFGEMCAPAFLLALGLFLALDFPLFRQQLFATATSSGVSTTGKRRDGRGLPIS
jgi:hypothetical protein